MPKIRGVKPELWTDENFVELSPYARLLWIGLWNHACDNGHLQDKSKQIKMRVLPTDDVNCAELLREIEAQGLIERAGGWITIPNLSHHQKPHKRWYVVCDKPGCMHPEGTSYGFDKPQKSNPEPESTVVQPLVNDELTSDNGGSTADVDVDGDVDLKVTRTFSSAVAAEAKPEPRADVLRVCEYLADAIAENGSKRPTITQAWRTSARLLLDKDGRTEAQVIAAIDWCQRGESERARFWRPNVLSMPKLRDKYDQMRLQAENERRASGPSNMRNHMSLVERLAAEDEQPTIPQIGERR